MDRFESYHYVASWADVMAGNMSGYQLIKLKADENNDQTMDNETDMLDNEQFMSPLDLFSVKVVLTVLYTIVFIVCIIGKFCLTLIT